MIKLFVGGFPLDIDEMQLVILFSAFGQVSTIQIVRDKVTKNCKGYAFIEMTTAEGAAEAVAGLDGTLMGERMLSVRAAAEKPVLPKGAQSRVPPVFQKVERAEAVKMKRPRKIS